MANKTLCPICSQPATQKFGLKLFCVYEHAAEWGQMQAQKNKAKKQSDAQKAQRKSDRERKQKLKTQSEWKSEAQEVFNKMRRLEELLWFKQCGIEPFCISCQKPIGNDVWACGHYKTRGARSDIALDRMNTYLQHNFQCNSNKSGDVEGIKIGLAVRFGEEEAKRIIDYCDVVQQTPKRTAEEWQLLKKEFNAEIRRLQKLLDAATGRIC